MSNFLVKDGDKASWQIPEGYPYKEVVTIEWDGNTEGVETVTAMEMSFYKVHDEPIPAPAPDVTITVTDARGYMNKITKVTEMPGAWFDSGYQVFSVEADIDLSEATGESGVMTIGTWVRDYITAVYATKVKALDPDFLPNGLGGGVFYEIPLSILANGGITVSEIRNIYYSGRIPVAVAKPSTNSKYVVCYPLVEIASGAVTFSGCQYSNGTCYFKSYTLDNNQKLTSINKSVPIGMTAASAVANVTAAPTAEEFNALLKSLRDAGILATE